MNVTELKKLVKEYFNLTDSTVRTKFAEATLEDGTTKIYWDGELAVGTRIFLLDAEGNQIPAPEGSHTLEDGTNVNQWLIKNNYAVAYQGENKELVQEQHQANKKILIKRGEL